MKIIQGVKIAREASNEGGAGGGSDGGDAGGGDASGNKLLGSAGAGDGGGNSGSTGGDGTGGGEDAGGSDARPDWLPEQFYVDGVPQYEKLAGSYTEAVAKIREKTDTLREEIQAELASHVPEGVPEDPTGYEVKTEGLFEIPEGMEIKLDAEDPLLNWWRETAHASKLNQEQFDAGIKTFFEHELAMSTDPAKETAALGENGAARIQAVDHWLAKNMDESSYNVLADSMTTAPQIEALEKLIELSKTGIPGGGEGAGQATLDLAELQSMMKDPRYHDPRQRDDAFVKKVQDGFKTLYPGEAQIG